MRAVTLVTKPGCGLCSKVEEFLRRLPSGGGFELRLAQLNDDAELERKYALRIPVVMVDGAEIFEAKEMDLGGLWRGRLENKLEGVVGRSALGT